MQSNLYNYYFNLRNEDGIRSFNWGVQHGDSTWEMLGMMFIPYNYTIQETLQRNDIKPYTAELIDNYFKTYAIRDGVCILKCLIPTVGFYK